MSIHHLASASLLAITLASILPAAVAAQILDLERLERVADSVAHDHLARNVAPGMSIAVAKDGAIVLEKGYGLADVENGVAARPETVYRIGSVTKQFTAVGIMRLVEQGALSLDDPLSTFFPDYPRRANDVTVRHLLNHTSGIRSYTGMGPDFWSQSRLDLSDEELVDLFDDEPLDFDPGDAYAYNNSAFFLLGMIVGQLEGRPYRDWVEEDVFYLLRMEGSFYCDDRRIIPFRAEGYDYEEGRLSNADYLSMNLPGAAGALCSTVGDLVTWTEALHGGGVVSDASLQQMTTPTVLNDGQTADYGFGLSLSERDGHRMVAHGGGINGFISFLSHYPDDDVTIAVLTNSGSGGASEIEEVLYRAVFDITGPMVFDRPLTPAEMSRYEGTYRIQLPDNTLDLRIYAEGGALLSQATGQSVSRLRSQGGHVFVPSFDDRVRLVFEMEGDRAVAFVLYQGGGEFRAERIE